VAALCPEYLDMMGPHVYEAARAEAPIHAQVWRLGPTRRERGSDSVRVRGCVVRIFRNRDRQVRWGQFVSFSIPVVNHERTDPPALSGTIYYDWEHLARTRWLEVFLECWEGQLMLVRSQVAGIRHPTVDPVCGPDVKGFVCPGNV
jgi:hypothetical protein